MTSRNDRAVRTAGAGEIRKVEKTSVVVEELGAGVDVQYNPEIINSVLKDLELQVNSKCAQIQKDADFMCTSIKQAFHLELIKLPNQVKAMSLARFRAEFGESLEAVTLGAIGMGSKGSVSASGSRENSNTSNRLHSSSSSGAKGSIGHKNGGSSVYSTPSGSKNRVAQTPGTAARRPRQGEVLLSANGSPLGSFDSAVDRACTAIKPRAGPTPAQTPSNHPASSDSAHSDAHVNAIPPTPGTVHVPLSNGEVVVVDLQHSGAMDDASIASMSTSTKLDALAKMQAMMVNMQSLMEKLQK